MEQPTVAMPLFRSDGTRTPSRPQATVLARSSAPGPEESSLGPWHGDLTYFSEAEVDASTALERMEMSEYLASRHKAAAQGAMSRQAARAVVKRRVAGTLIVTLAVACTAGPAVDQKGGREESEVVISGALYLDLHVDAPCAPADAPPELSGVTLSFRDADEVVLGHATSGPIGHQPLEFGEGKDGWQFPGCRFVSLYSVEVERADSYTVAFRARPGPGAEQGTSFVGIDELGEQTITHEELEANAFAWDFEVQPSYVVGH